MSARGKKAIYFKGAPHNPGRYGSLQADRVPDCYGCGNQTTSNEKSHGGLNFPDICRLLNMPRGEKPMAGSETQKCPQGSNNGYAFFHSSKDLVL